MPSDKRLTLLEDVTIQNMHINYKHKCIKQKLMKIKREIDKWTTIDRLSQEL